MVIVRLVSCGINNILLIVNSLRVSIINEQQFTWIFYKHEGKEKEERRRIIAHERKKRKRERLRSVREKREREKREEPKRGSKKEERESKSRKGRMREEWNKR